MLFVKIAHIFWPSGEGNINMVTANAITFEKREVPYQMLKIVALAILAILTCLLSIANAGESLKYVGSLISDDQPVGYKNSGGSCLPDINGSEATCTMALSGGVLTTPSGQKTYVLWLTSNIGKDSDGRILWRAEDALESSDRGPTLSSENCKSKKYPSAIIVASGSWQSRKKPQVGGYLRPILKAWMIDLPKKRFQAIPVAGVTCEINEDRN